MSIETKKIIDSLNLIYYEYDNKNKTLLRDSNYSNKFIDMEFFKVTYYLSKKHIPFEVLNDKSIKLEVKNSSIEKLYSMIKEKINNRNKNIFLLNDYKIKWAKNIPLFKIVPHNKKINLKTYDAIIFTSKNAINTIDRLNKDWKNIPSYVISEQTAKLVKDLNGNLQFISKKKHGNDFAYELINELQGKKVLYLRGKDIVSDLIKILKKNDISCDDEIIYENQFNELVKKIKIPKNSKIIFTSPSTVSYFFKLFSWDNSYTAISIGNTTAKYFPKNIKPVIADNTSFKSCVSKALEI